MNNKKLIVYGGAFNPPSIAHIKLAKSLLDYIKNAEKILFMPVGDHYKKKELISSYHRVNMLKIACAEDKRLEVSSIETDSKVKLCTIDTLDIIKGKYPEYEIFFLMGTDNLRDIHNWKEYDRLLKTYKIIVMDRDKDTLENVIKDVPMLKSYKDNIIKIDKLTHTNISSTKIRNIIKEGKSIMGLTTNGVAHYIENNNLYK